MTIFKWILECCWPSNTLSWYKKPQVTLVRTETHKNVCSGVHVSSLLLSWIITALSLPSLFSPSPLIYYIFLLSWCLAGGSFLCWNANASDPAHTSKSFSWFSYLAGLDAAKIKQVGTICGQESTRRIGDYKVKYGYSDIELLRWGKGFCPRLLHWREILPFLLTSLFIANVTFFFWSAAKSKPIIAEPEIHGGYPLDGVTGFLVLMSEGLYKALEAAHGPGQANQVKTPKHFKLHMGISLHYIRS